MGDRIAAENYLQHAEHYFRIINAENDGDSRGRANAQRANRQQQEDQFTDDGDTGTEEAAVVESVTPPPGNGADGEEIGEGSEQPAVAFPNGEDLVADGSAGDEAPAPKKPRPPRTPRGRGRGPRASGNSGGGKTPPAQSDE